jgi:pimeloyl-ACP methyl ester carboxylesterase
MHKIHSKLLRYCCLALTLLMLWPSGADAEIQFRSTGRNSKLIVLVHGLWGDPLGSFGAWPLVMVNDRLVINGQSLSQFSIAALGYPSSRHDRLTPPQAARNLLEELAIEFKRNDYEEVFFVGHSLGGLVVKQILIDALNRSPQIAERTRAVISIAAPSTTARLGSMLSRLPLAKTMAGTMIKYLLTPEGTQYLHDLDDSWSDIIAGANGKVRLSQHCAYETRPIGVPPFSTILVPQQHSESNCTSKFVANNENHVTIVKPSADSPIHSWVRDQILSASGPTPIVSWAPLRRPECRPYPTGMLFRVGGYGVLKRLSFMAVVDQDDCGHTIIATVMGRGNPIIFGGHTGDACTGHLHYNSMGPGLKVTMPRSCVNDAGL